MKPKSSVVPWYHHRWPWLLMAGPAIVIVAGFVTFWLAVTSRDSLVAADYYKQGLAVNAVLAREAEAARLGVSADVARLPGHTALAVTLTLGESAPPQALMLTLAHPVDGRLDRQLRASREASGRYVATTDRPASGRWRVMLEDSNGQWRLTGVMPQDEDRAVLRTRAP